MITHQDFERNLASVLHRIQASCELTQRSPSEIKLVAVTKHAPKEAPEWSSRPEIFAIAENTVQSAVNKGASLSRPVRWEFIGHLQSNKARAAVQRFTRIQSVESIALIETLQRITAQEGRPVLPILLQINTAEDPAKFGATPQQASRLLGAALKCPNLRVEGLMTIAENTSDLVAIRKAFSDLRILRGRLEEEFQYPLPELSMGMSNDFGLAIEQGSTLVRLGNALFSKLPHSPF